MCIHVHGQFVPSAIYDMVVKVDGHFCWLRKDPVPKNNCQKMALKLLCAKSNVPLCFGTSHPMLNGRLNILV